MQILAFSILEQTDHQMCLPFFLSYQWNWSKDLVFVRLYKSYKDRGLERIKIIVERYLSDTQLFIKHFNGRNIKRERDKNFTIGYQENSYITEIYVDTNSILQRCSITRNIEIL